MDLRMKAYLLSKKAIVKRIKFNIMIRRTRKGQTTRLNTRVDFTPMVDMMMLLLTFFMFCTTLLKPQIMNLAMPTLEEPTATPPIVDGVRAITFILADANKVYYYEGKANYEDYTSLKEINYSQLRSVLANKNRHIVEQVNELTKKKNAKEISEDVYKEALSEIKKQKEGVVAMIKPTEEAIYKNLVDVLDEMAICSVARYAVIDMTEGDDFLLKNYETKGLYAQENSMKE